MNFKKSLGLFIKKINFDNKTIKSLLIFFIILFIIDYSGVLDLYGESFIRRIMHMYKRIDYLSYKNKLKPFCIPVKKFIEEKDIQLLNSIKTVDTTDIPWFTRKNTSTYAYNNMNANEKQILNQISRKVKAMVEQRIDKKLYNWPTNTDNFYTYYGENSHHKWHVDPQNVDSIYNVIICIDRIGNISPFQYKDKDNNIHTVHTQIGDAVIFRGGTTIHQIPACSDCNSDTKRKVLSLSYTTNKVKLNNNNMCTYIEGGSNYLNLIKLVLQIFITGLVCSYLSGSNYISYELLLILIVLSLLIGKYIPQYIDMGIGTGRATSFTSNIVILLVFMLFTLSIKTGSLIFVYFALSEVFFSRKWVEYN